MQAEIKKLPKSEIEIAVEVPADDFERYYKEGLEEISKEAVVKGFRPGKIPEKILEERVGSDALLREAAEIAVKNTYPKILNEHKIEAIGRPEITITKIARQNPLFYKARVAVLPEIILPDYKKIAVNVREVTESEEAVVETGDKKDGGEEKEDEKEKEQKSREKKRVKILEAICESSKMDIPDALIQAEKEKMLAELKSSIENMGMKWQDYLNRIKKGEQDLNKELEKDALRRVKYGLVLREVAEKENIQVTAEELNREVDEILKQAPSLDRGYLMGYAYGIIRNEKVFKFLETC